MPRSLAVRSEYIPRVKQAVKRNGYPTQQVLAEALNLSRSTVNLFLNGKQVDYLNFYEICHKLGLDPEEIGDWDNLERLSTKDHSIEQKEKETVEVDFSKYIERPPLEKICYETLIQPGSLLRIQSTKSMGKTLLIDKILNDLDRNEYKVVKLSFLQTDQTTLNNLDSLGKWFCLVVSRSLGIENQVKDRWEEGLGNMNVSYYFEEYLLSSINKNLVLVLEDVDNLFSNQSVADNFLSLFRFWHEAAKIRIVWQKLRLILTYSTEEYVPINIAHSPLFNVGIEVKLRDFTRKEVLELANRYDAHLTLWDINIITNIIGGHPYLLQKAIYAITKQQISLESFANTAATEEGIYGDHLRGHLLNLKEYPELEEGMKKVVNAKAPVDLGTINNKKLHSLGLVEFEQNAVIPRYKLYADYFRSRL